VKPAHWTMRAFLALLAQYNLMAGDSWFTWHVVLIAAVGEALTASELERFRAIVGRDPPRDRLQLLAFFVGRRGGKDTAAAVLVIFMVLCRRWPLAAGEVGSALVSAVDRDQVQVAFRRILGTLEAVPALAAEISNVTRDTIVLCNGVEIKVATSDGAAVRGRTLVMALLDEFWFLGHEQATELVRALRPALATTPGSLIAVISSVYDAGGPAYEMFRQWGEEIPGQLIVKGTTRDFNPTISQDFIDREYQLDAVSASAEYGSQPRTDCTRLFDAVLLDSATRSSPRELPCRKMGDTGTMFQYHAGLDVSGGRGDAAAVAVAHRDRERIVIDAVRHWPAPHDPLIVASEISKFLGTYGLTSALADNYAAEFATSAYREAGVALTPAEINRSEGYLHALPLFSSGRIEIPDDPRLRAELLGLERRTSAAGRETIDHRPGAHDDVANALALAAYACGRTSARTQGLFVARSTALSGYFDQATNGSFVRQPWE
jgi:hypothetical protein